MDKFFQDLEKLKREVWALRNQLGDDDSEAEDETLKKLTQLEETISLLEASMNEGDNSLQSSINACQTTQSNMQSEIDSCISSQSAMQTSINNCISSQTQLQSQISTLEGKIPTNAIQLGDVKSTTIIGGATDNGYIDLIVSSTQKIRFLFGTTNTKATITFDVPFASLIGFTSTYAPTASTSMTCYAYKATVGECTTTSIAFMGNSATTSYVRYAVWGYINI
ncbi:MAG: hypothetical protein IJX25_05115 [Clostridia bacterium]|nr:hypothetical protein [Clostridia bacterium]MBQ8792652.1 hypothetical protein [Clostridia bacterium]